MIGLPDKRPPGMDTPLTVPFLRYLSKLNVAAFKATDGLVGGTWRFGSAWNRPVPVLLLEHEGRKSGRLFETPLLYMEDGDDVVVVASQGGLPRNPQWYANVQSAPDVHVRLRGRGRVAVRARTATPDERDVLWPRLVKHYADFAKSQGWTDREMPVVVLEPR